MVPISFERTAKLVSVVVPVLYTTQYLPDCLSSIIHQTYPDIEIIVVDDQSADNCEEVLHSWMVDSEYQQESSRLTYVKLSPEAKQAGSATVGLFLGRGEYLALQGADDISHPERLAKQIQYLTEHPEVDLVGTNYESFQNEDFQHRSAEFSTWLVYGKQQIRESYRVGHHCMCDSTLCLRGRTFDIHGGWTRRLDSIPHVEFIGRYIASGVLVENLAEPLYYLRNHPYRARPKALL